MEAAACRFLEGQGLRVVARNWRCRLGELDLVMTEHDTLVFVEVRCRRRRGAAANSGYGDGAASVTPTKQRRLLRAARHWLMLHRGRGDAPPCRFDVVAVDSLAGEPVFRWVRGAFDA